MELVVKFSPRIYIQHVIYENLRPVLYVILKKAIYGCLRLVLLLYGRLVAYLRDKVLKHNPYAP